MASGEPATVATLVKLLLVLAVVAGASYAISLGLAAFKDAVSKAKGELAGKGISLTESGVAVKTDKRAFTQEETQDKLQRGIAKGFGAASFNVPWVLGASSLAGSSHDKHKAEHDRTRTCPALRPAHARRQDQEEADVGICTINQSQLCNRAIRAVPVVVLLRGIVEWSEMGQSASLRRLRCSALLSRPGRPCARPRGRWLAAPRSDPA